MGRGSTLNSVAPPTFYFEDPKTGHIYTPSGPLGPKVTRKLSRQGYVQREITSDRDYAKFKRNFGRQLAAEHEKAAQAQLEFHDQFWKPYIQEQRQKLLNDLQNFSEDGKQFALEAMREVSPE